MRSKINFGFLGLASLLLISACASDSDDDEQTTAATMYQIKVTNLTSNQPLTPPAAILHGDGYTAWSLGASASTDLEKLAEGGDTSDFITTAKASSKVQATATLSSAPFGPGESAMATLETSMPDSAELTVASMLANTNDAFTGVTNLDISMLTKGESITVLAHALDAGTEANSESSGTIPGPVDGGTGFDATRNDGDFISIHPGVVSMDDGLATSVLNESHRWLGPVAKIDITRMN